MKVLFLVLALFFLKISSSSADVGCNLGDNIYPDLTAEIYRDCPGCIGIPVYSTSNPVHLVNNMEQACGVPRNSVNTTSLGSCKVKTGPSTYTPGSLNSYDPSLNDCPIDSGALILLVVFSIIGVFKMKNVLILSSIV
ncbi:hypothetical protein [Pedobacter miscanthi]|uniref:hypothetical protein n=1 Tax=Pedobacter miscanthi TaxID=2259170 RepID=UPI002931425A|nr:hypothetical protein [Pedobacter miscanthi]